MDLQRLIQQGMALHQAGRLAEAEPFYIQAMKLAPRDYPVLHVLGLLRCQQNRIPEALALMETALEVNPGAPETLSNYGLALDAAGRHAEALRIFDRLLVARPGDAGSSGNRATVLVNLRRFDEALTAFEQSLQRDPRNFETHNNYGLTLQSVGRLEDAAASFAASLALQPDFAEARVNRAFVLRQMGAHTEALAEADQVLAQTPRNLGALLTRAGTLASLGRTAGSLDAYEAVLMVAPDHAAALAARGELRSRRGDLAGGIADLERAMALQPELPYLRGTLLHTRMQAGDWSGLAAAKAELDRAVRDNKPAVEPFIYQALTDSLEDLQRCARKFGRPAMPLSATRAPRKPGRVRVGYVCGEFRVQATMLLSAGLYEAHDRTQFEIVAFDNGYDDGSALRRRLNTAFDRIIPIAGLPDSETALKVRAEGIDILVNLNGYFGAARTGLFAQRPAPVQVNYLGFPGTLGTPDIDYIIADHDVIASGEEIWFDEKVVRLPGSYQVNDDKRIRPAPAHRVDHGLPETGFVFCNFNYSYKITPQLFAIWMRLLGAVPGSVLWLLSENDVFADNLRKTARVEGIDPERLIFAQVVPPETHLARLAAADLVLDTLPYNAHTTASDALWMGVPVLTCRGNAFAGRVAASLLKAMDLPELITDSLGEYEGLALALARDPGRLSALRARLETNRATAPLFDTSRTARQIEAAYMKMLERWSSGEAPAAFNVPY